MSRSQSKLPTALRICAAVTLILWLIAVALCNVECLHGCDGHATVAYHDEGDGAEHGHSEAAAGHSREAEEHSRGSHHNDGDKSSCCSTLKTATVQIAKPIVISKPLLQPLYFLSSALETRASELDSVNAQFFRQAEHCKWVFTPEVCLGPAFRTHAPPSLN